jgi:hypothetical protein
MLRISFEQFKVLVRQPPNVCWQLAIVLPEPWAGEVSHSSVQRLASKSARASSASLSSLPALISSSICASHACASKRLNHSPKSTNSERDSSVMADLISSTCIMVLLISFQLLTLPPDVRTRLLAYMPQLYNKDASYSTHTPCNEQGFMPTRSATFARGAPPCPGGRSAPTGSWPGGGRRWPACAFGFPPAPTGGTRGPGP